MVPDTAPKTDVRGIDVPVLIVSTLTAFFATLFATLLLLRADDRAIAEPVTQASAATRTLPPVDAPPPDSILRIDRRSEPRDEPSVDPESLPAIDPMLRARLEQLGVKCANEADC
jgi:hypothetical protein